MGTEERRQFEVRVSWWKTAAIMSAIGLVLTAVGLLLSVRAFASLPERVEKNEQAIQINSTKIDVMAADDARWNAEFRERLATIQANTAFIKERLDQHMKE